MQKLTLFTFATVNALSDAHIHSTSYTFKSTWLPTLKNALSGTPQLIPIMQCLLS